MAHCFMFRRDMFGYTRLEMTTQIMLESMAMLFKVSPNMHSTSCERKRINAIVGMSSNGIIASELTTLTVDGDGFFDFIRGRSVTYDAAI